MRIPLTPYRFDPDEVDDPAWASVQVWGDRAGYPEGLLADLPGAVTSRRLGLFPTLLEDALAPGMAVLDLGCGAGLDLHLVARGIGPEGCVAGVDVSRDLVVIAREHAPAGCGVDVRVGNAEALPWRDGRFDVVHANCVLSLLPHRAQVLREASRVLGPAGVIVLSDVVLTGALDPALQRALCGQGNGVGSAPLRDVLLGELGDAGFEVVTHHDEVLDRDALLRSARERSGSPWSSRQSRMVADLVGRLADRIAVFRARARKPA